MIEQSKRVASFCSLQNVSISRQANRVAPERVRERDVHSCEPPDARRRAAVAKIVSAITQVFGWGRLLGSYDLVLREE